MAKVLAVFSFVGWKEKYALSEESRARINAYRNVRARDEPRQISENLARLRGPVISTGLAEEYLPNSFCHQTGEVKRETG